MNYLEDLYTTGARNVFVVNVPTIDRSPLIEGQGSDSVGNYSKCIDAFNSQLPALVRNWQVKHADVGFSSKENEKARTDPKQYRLA